MAVAVQDVKLQDPSLAGFTAWVYTFMGVPKTALPPTSLFLQLAYDESVNIAYIGLKAVKNRAPFRPMPPQSPPLAPSLPIIEPPHPAHPIVEPPPQVSLQSPSVYAIAVETRKWPPRL